MAWLSRKIHPSMFQRRLMLLSLLGMAAIASLLAQTTRLTIAQGASWRERAESALSESWPIATVRGSIRDRKGRVLAQDKASFDVAVEYPVLSGQWSYEQARRAAAKANAQAWRELGEDQREALVAQWRVPFDQQVGEMMRLLADVGKVAPSELQARRDTVTRRVQQMASEVWLRRLEERSREADEPVSLEDVAQPLREQQAHHPLLLDVSDEGRARIDRLIALAADRKAHPELSVWRSVRIEPSTRRAYPLETMTIRLDRTTFPSPLRRAEAANVQVEGVALHVVGAMREIWAEDHVTPYRVRQSDGSTRINLAGYLPGDLLGRWGIEKSQEIRLRGRRGERVAFLDTQSESYVPPIPGEDVTLSLDIQLQARIQAILSPDPDIGLMRVQPWHRQQQEETPDTEPQANQPLSGAAVVLAVDSGEVLAAVTAPGFSLRQLREQPQTVWADDVNLPYVNRAVAYPYEPGSTLKPIVEFAAVTEGKAAPGEHIACTGHLDAESPNRFRCWIYKQHHMTHNDTLGHSPSAAESLTHSCNIRYYTLGRRVGAQRLVWWFDQFGMGRCLLGLGPASELSEEVAGNLPSVAELDRMEARSQRSLRDVSTLMGIGQGPLRWTPLQAANAYAAVARSGIVLPPTFLHRENPTRRTGDEGLRVHPAAVAEVMEGLYGVVNETGGTGHHLSLLDRERIFNISGVKVMGKSGTATAADRRVDSDRDGRITGMDQVVRSGSHAWFIALVQRPGSARPDFAVAVVVEYGGSGGAVAGPIVNQILHALRAEGYL